MTLIPDIHIVAALEIKETINMGFRYQIQKEKPEKFINRNFPNFDILKFCKQIDQLLAPLCLEPIHKVIRLSDNPQPEMLIQYYSHNSDDISNGLALSRNFIKHEEDLLNFKNYVSR